MAQDLSWARAAKQYQTVFNGEQRMTAPALTQWQRKLSTLDPALFLVAVGASVKEDWHGLYVTL
jgi:hypothetical protein